MHLNALVPEKFFLGVAFIFGLFFLLITPPFQAPDEPNHFFKAWQISQGEFKSVKQDQRVGGYLPVSLQEFVTPYFRIAWNKNNTFSVVATEEVNNITTECEKTFYDFSNTALYSPICHAPQALGIFAGRLFSSNVKTIFYISRLLSFLTWLALVFFAIRLIPICKWLLTYLALLPMSLFINMSLSADLMTNGICFLFFAYVLRLCFQEPPIRNRQLMALSGLVILLASVKIVYAPFLLLLFLLPKSKFRSTGHYLCWVTGGLAAGLSIILFWGALISDLYVPYEDYNKTYREFTGISPAANAHKQLEFIKEDPTQAFSVICHSIGDCYGSHIESYVGVFGWLDTHLPGWMVYTLYALIYVIASGEKDLRLSLSWKKRTLLFLVFMLILSLLFLSQHLSWVLVGAPSVWHIQGRYLIPFYPLLFMMFYGLFRGKKAIVLLVAAATIMSLIYSCVVLYSRYVGY